ncbi:MULTISPECIES: hypothetical protein [unclassified Rickettsia]
MQQRRLDHGMTDYLEFSFLASCILVSFKESTNEIFFLLRDFTKA